MSYRIGSSKRDITGPAAELGMMGFSDVDQKTVGIHSRLYARTFVVEEQDNHVVIVSAQLCRSISRNVLWSFPCHNSPQTTSTGCLSCPQERLKLSTSRQRDTSSG